MNRTWRITAPLLVLGLAGVLFGVLWESGPAVQQSSAVLPGEAQSLSEPEKRAPVLTQTPEQQEPVPPFTSPADPSPALPASVPPSAERCSTNELLAVLPLWMREEADVDTYADERVVAGSPITRVRGRYAWPNGSEMEVEISDLGDTPSDLLLRSLGCNTALIDTETNVGFSKHINVKNQPGTFEYDYDTEEGSLLVLVADRFLVEVQLELLPSESFDTVIEHLVPLAMLEEMAAKEKKKSTEQE